ncbi:TetR/AcrR family transcriptional regulator [Acidiferrimicrobium sp. IK]|uniref:TetR/AcrR family transcriptional regulator n=1 Tax=Acidiferrimicrobium sp. IK TaxID=2871700 RepID=UPI0021CB8FFB|nr:TetR/AcrR family transcriptional regulator [Acidiferrimicrobium sp. IK]MCU4186812.1 TetR/AcrR family transcriptional regulator [Acidiferrimicrobium sp. IK]
MPEAAAGAAAVGSAPWWVDHQARLARRKPRPDGLTVERVLDAALRVVDTEGLESLTMRRLAEALGTATASLYRHVASREALLVLMVDRLLGEVRLPPDGLSGRRQVEWLAHELRAVLLSHASLLPAVTASPVVGPNAMRGADRGLEGFLAMGLDGRRTVSAYLALVDYVFGTVYFDTGPGPTGGRHNPGLIDVAVAEGYPTLWARRHEMAAVSEDEVFAFGLAAFLDGLTSRPSPLHANDGRL